MNYLSNDELERFWFQYKAECEPHGISLEQFCNTQKISYRAMDNWSRQIRSKVVPVEVEGKPTATPETAEPQAQTISETCAQGSRYVSCRHRNGQTKARQKREADNDGESAPVRIMVTIKATNGLSVFQKNLSYEGLKLLVERLEGVC